MQTDTEWTHGVDRTRASAARVYDYLIGGTHHLAPDRAVGDAMAAINPEVPRQARANRAFLTRAVTELVNAGVRQFLDIGSGIPTAGNVHEIAQAIAPDARVVYVDIDPVAVMTATQLLRDNPLATALQGDLSRPDALLEQMDMPDLRVLDLDQPVALMLVAVTHFLADDAPYAPVDILRRRLVPGSHLVLSQICTDALREEETSAVQRLYKAKTAPAPVPRSRDEIARFFGDWTVLDPGLTWVAGWRPEASSVSVDFADDPVRSVSYGGVARKS